MAFSHKKASDGANQRGYTGKQKNTVNKLTRAATRQQKIVDTSDKATKGKKK